jgi:uncharacterized repeat protein (TIGR03843 family)
MEPGEAAPAGPSVHDLLTRGEITVKGRMPWASNATFLVELALDGANGLAVYKPGRGERPLWDFPPELFRREIAAYRFSEALGWGVVPLTVPREGPYGAGSLQQFVDADFEQHYFTMNERADLRDRLQRICLFDLAANNADRKSGHCLLGPDGDVYAIDNGLTFHVEPKLRTVIWDFAGEAIPATPIEDFARLCATGLPADLVELLEPGEQKALMRRIGVLVRERRFPKDRSGARYPWPLV